MKKFSITILLLFVLSSLTIKAQSNNQITYMLLLNEAKQNFATIIGEQFNKSEDGSKTFHSCKDGFLTTTEFITIDNNNGKQKSYYTLYFNLSELNSDDLIHVSKIVEDAIGFANLLVSGGKYKGEDINNPETNGVTTRLKDTATENAVMEITSGKYNGSQMVMITFFGANFYN